MYCHFNCRCRHNYCGCNSTSHVKCSPITHTDLDYHKEMYDHLELLKKDLKDYSFLIKDNLIAIAVDYEIPNIIDRLEKIENYLKENGYEL